MNQLKLWLTPVLTFLKLTPQCQLDKLPWSKSPPQDLKIKLVLGEIRPRKRKVQVDQEVSQAFHTEDSYYFNLVESYELACIYSINDNYLESSVETTFRETNKIRKRAFQELNLDLAKVCGNKIKS